MARSEEPVTESSHIHCISNTHSIHVLHHTYTVTYTPYTEHSYNILHSLFLDNYNVWFNIQKYYTLLLSTLLVGSKPSRYITWFSQHSQHFPTSYLEGITSECKVKCMATKGSVQSRPVNVTLLSKALRIGFCLECIG